MSRLAPLTEVTHQIIGSAMRVHSALGPGLLESAYEACLTHEIVKTGLKVAKQIPLPIRYDGVNLDAGYRLDMIINDNVVVEIKAVDKLQPIHSAQLLSYLKLGGYKLGLLINFNVVHLRDGIKRIANNL